MSGKCTQCIHCKKWSTPTGHKPMRADKQRVICEKTIPVRFIKWRRLNTEDNENMRAAVWLYRAIPIISSTLIQKTFNIAVKTLMRYVRSSYDINFEKYGLYFGDVNAFGETDRSRLFMLKYTYESDIVRVDITDEELCEMRKYPNIPIGAAKYLDIFLKRYLSLV